MNESEYRDDLIRRSGELLINLQILESIIKACCAFLGIELSVEDLLSAESVRRERTMGFFLKRMREKVPFNDSFKATLEEFVRLRNTFIHRLWQENADGMPPTGERLARIGKHIDVLDERLGEVRVALLGVYSLIGNRFQGNETVQLTPEQAEMVAWLKTHENAAVRVLANPEQRNTPSGSRGVTSPRFQRRA